MQRMENVPPAGMNPVDAARLAIWRLFQEGYVDEDMATAGLLAVDLGTRRARRKTSLAKLASDKRPPWQFTGRQVSAAVGSG